jgi:hypothetical protein
MTLLEVSAALMLLAAVALISVHVFGGALRMQHQLQRGHTVRAQYDHATRQLRKDVWNAAEIHPLPQGGVEIVQEPQSIVWRFDHQAQRLERHTAEATMLWMETGHVVRFSPTAAGLEAIWTQHTGKRETSVSLRLPSQVLLAREVGR